MIQPSIVRFQKQKFHHRPEEGEYGDCLRTAFACLLGMDRDDVPHFGEGGPPVHVRSNAERDWLQSQGLCEITIPYQGDLEPILSSFACLNTGEFYMLTGTSRTGCRHVVICRNEKIVWDTSLTDSGIVAPCSDGFYYVSVLAKRFVKEAIR